MKNVLGLAIFLIFINMPAFSKELNMVPGKIYVMNFNEEIQNFHTDNKILDAQILHTIFNDKKQLVLSLKNPQDTTLQIKTEKEYVNYDIKNAKKSSKDLIEIDFPPFENLDVDVWGGN